MKTTLKTLVNSEAALQHLAEQKLPIKTAYRLQKALRKITEAVSDFDKARSRLVYELAGVEEGQPAKVPEEKLADFNKEMMDLLEEEVELEGVVQVSLDELEGSTLSVGDLMLLDFLIVNEE
jgi:hypothetical protein